MYLKIVALAYHLGNLVEFLRHHFRHFHPIFHIVIVFDKSFQLLHVVDIIRVVVVDIHRGIFIESFNQHAFTIHISKSERPSYFIHAFLASPLHDSIHQCTAHASIIDKVEPSETHLLAVPSLISPMVDDGCNASHNLPVSHSKKVFRLATFERRITVMSQSIHLFGIKKRNSLLTLTIHLVVKLHELFQLLTCGYFLYFYISHHRLMLSSRFDSTPTENRTRN